VLAGGTRAGGNVGIGTARPTYRLRRTSTPAARSATTPGTNFLGTTDSAALELKVDSRRALRFISLPTVRGVPMVCDTTPQRTLTNCARA
jgi:hypothetical protein